MNYKDYSRTPVFYEAFIDIAFLPDGSDNYSDLITMWIGDFQTLMDLVPLNDEGMYVGLACHYQVDTPWEECEEEPWKVDNIELSLSQLLNVKNLLLEKSSFSKPSDDNIRLIQICNDICIVFEKAKLKCGTAYIKYYY